MVVYDTTNNYWRLDQYLQFNKTELQQHLKDLGFDGVGKRPDRDDLLRIGQVRYDALSDHQLLQTARNLKVEGSFPFSSRGKLNKFSRSRLLHEVERMDHRGQSFKRFMDLPPELRAQIYEYYVASFPQTIVTPTKPPLVFYK